MKTIQTNHVQANGRYYGPWCIEGGILEYIGPLEHYLHETLCGDYMIYMTTPMFNDWGELEFYSDGVMMRKYKLILISYDKGTTWRSLID